MKYTQNVVCLICMYTIHGKALVSLLILISNFWPSQMLVVTSKLHDGKCKTFLLIFYEIYLNVLIHYCVQIENFTFI